MQIERADRFVEVGIRVPFIGHAYCSNALPKGFTH
jgi:hypothetical protein